MIKCVKNGSVIVKSHERFVYYMLLVGSLINLFILCCLNKLNQANVVSAAISWRSY